MKEIPYTNDLKSYELKHWIAHKDKKAYKSYITHVKHK